MKKKIAAGAILAAAISGIGSTRSADASLLIDVRATRLNGVAITNTGTNQKSLTGIKAGDTIHVQYNAVVVGADNNGTNDGFASVEGTSLTTGVLKGNLGPGTIFTDPDTFETSGPFYARSTFNTIMASQPPKNVDLDGDSDLDIGIKANPINSDTVPNPTPPPANFGNLTFRAASMQLGSGTANTTTKVLGEADIVMTSGLITDGALLEYRIGIPSGANDNPFWQEDGITKSAGTGSVSTSPLNLNGGGAVPEPASLGLLGVAGLGLLRRRRA